MGITEEDFLRMRSEMDANPDLVAALRRNPEVSAAAVQVMSALDDLQALLAEDDDWD